MPSFLSNLNAEWRTLSCRASSRRSIRRWAAEYPVLDGLGDLDEILQLRSKDTCRAPAVLRALAGLAPTDDLAARTLLHALMPGLVRIAHTSASDDPDAIEELVSLAWERIRTYPSDRLGPVAANVLLDVRKRYRCSRRVDAPQSTPLDEAPEPTVPSAEDEALERVTVLAVVDAYRRGIISRSGYELIVRSRLAGIPLSQIAAEQQTSAQVLAMRRRRAEQRLQRELPLAS